MRSYAEQADISKIQNLRKQGESISEISIALHLSKSTVFRYIQGVTIADKYQAIWREKRG